jgi:poly(beta-D-mannuronate) lyase
MKKITFLLLLFFQFSCIESTFATEYQIKSAAELKKLSLLPGDIVILVEGECKDQLLHLKGKGTETSPIILKSMTPGQIISGNSSLKIDGEWLVVQGLNFTNGYSEKTDVVTFTKSSSYCRFTNSSILNYNHPDKKIDYKWVSLYGSNNRLDHCAITGKTHQGTAVVVWLSETPNYNVIDHNYFGPRPPLDGNGGEIIRIGTSDWSQYDSFTKVDSNIFDRCDGETEIVSIKSGHNMISNNIFYECDGTVTFRHGNNSEVCYNYFIGNNKKNTGGIRIIGENQKVHHNYLHGLAGSNLRAAISVMNALITPELNEYWQVKNAEINNNMIVDCKEAFTLGSGKNDKRILAANGVNISNNYVMNGSKLLNIMDKPQNLVLKDNQVKGLNLQEGFVSFNTKLAKATNKMWIIKGTEKSPFWLNEKIGPDWQKIEFSGIIK